jgi:DNA recombination protein RmuC
MDLTLLFVGLIVGLLAGGFGVFFWARGLDARRAEMAGRVESLEKELSGARGELNSAQVNAAKWEAEASGARSMAEERLRLLGEMEKKLADLREEHDGLQMDFQTQGSELAALKAGSAERETAFEARLKDLQNAEERLKETFQNLHNEAVAKNVDTFLKQSEEVLKKYKESADGDLGKRKQEIEGLVKPLQERLKELSDQSEQLERSRKHAYGSLEEQLKSLGDQQKAFQTEAAQLRKALQDPGQAGSWGEMALERVVEMAGLQEGINYQMQASFQTDDGKSRPDMMIFLPGGRLLTVDAKAPLRNYLEALAQTDPDLRDGILKTFARNMRDKVKELQKRDYGGQKEDAIDFTVLFIPAEAAFRAAVEADGNLIEDAMQNNVFIASPTTLLALMRAVAYGWRQERLAQEAKNIQAHGQKLYEALATMAEHFAKVGASLNSSVKHYNSAVGSLERSVIPNARKMKELGVSSNKSMEELPAIDTSVRQIEHKELRKSSVSLPSEIGLFEEEITDVSSE